MSKNKSRGGFDKFAPKEQSGGPAVAEPNPAHVVVPVDDDDEAGVDEPTDPSDDQPKEPDPAATDPTLGRGPVPLGAYQCLEVEAMKATTIAEQEEILARMHPKHNTMRDPGEDYKRCLVSGRSLPPFVARADADPLMIRAKDFLERIIAGGLIMPSAYSVYNQGVDLVTELLDNLREKPNAESSPGSSGGDSKVGS